MCLLHNTNVHYIVPNMYKDKGHARVIFLWSGVYYKGDRAPPRHGEMKHLYAFEIEKGMPKVEIFNGLED